jgi:DNA-binding MltR family transcriptional regulator
MAKHKNRTFDDLASMIVGFGKEFSTESDRGTALVIGAYLDVLLASILRKHCVNDPDVVEELLGVDRPLGTFSSRIKLSYCLGLIRHDQWKDLDTVRKIRNACGHTHENVSFDSSPLRELCHNLQQLKISEELRHKMSPEEQHILIDQFKGNRLKFIGNAVHLAFGLMVRGTQLKHLTVGEGFIRDKEAKLPFEKSDA